MPKDFLFEQVLQSLKPLYCSQMAKGLKTNEVRKNFPKAIKEPFTVYVYCTKGNGTLFLRHGNAFLGHWEDLASGKVIGQYTCTGKTVFEPVMKDGKVTYDISDEEVATTCVTREEIEAYGNGKTLYFWHVADFIVYDEPKELSDFCVNACEQLSMGGCNSQEGSCSYQLQCSEGDFEPCIKRFTTPPQAWSYAVLYPQKLRRK